MQACEPLVGRTSALPRLARHQLPLARPRVVVTACSEHICVRRKRVNVSQIFAGQRVGIKEVDEGVWIVSVMHYDLGLIGWE